MVEVAQLDVIVDQLRDQRQPRVLEIRGGRRCIRLALGDLVANLAPKIELVADAAAQNVVIIVARREPGDERGVDRFSRALDAAVESHGGKQPRPRLIAHGLRLRIVGQSSGECRVPVNQPLLETVELGVLVEPPPAVARQAVRRLRLSPRSELLVRIGRRDLRSLERRRERTGAEHQRQRRAGAADEVSPVHVGFSAWRRPPRPPGRGRRAPDRRCRCHREGFVSLDRRAPIRRPIRPRRRDRAAATPA